MTTNWHDDCRCQTASPQCVLQAEKHPLFQSPPGQCLWQLAALLKFGEPSCLQLCNFTLPCDGFIRPPLFSGFFKLWSTASLTKLTRHTSQDSFCRICQTTNPANKMWQGNYFLELMIWNFSANNAILGKTSQRIIILWHCRHIRLSYSKGRRCGFWVEQKHFIPTKWLKIYSFKNQALWLTFWTCNKTNSQENTAHEKEPAPLPLTTEKDHTN